MCVCMNVFLCSTIVAGRLALPVACAIVTAGAFSLSLCKLHIFYAIYHIPRRYTYADSLDCVTILALPKASHLLCKVTIYTLEMPTCYWRAVPTAHIVGGSGPNITISIHGNRVTCHMQLNIRRHYTITVPTSRVIAKHCIGSLDCTKPY